MRRYRHGDAMLISAGMPFGTPDATNLLRIARTRSRAWQRIPKTTRYEILEWRGNPRVAKYNRRLRIEPEPGKEPVCAGSFAFSLSGGA